ncbi:Uma2 family endonuclease [Geminocystis herdmanii]|uniref:Uma2 family endonuclease n=1 Tax=Geminocystis herdmanii TaxID=669359 RepID=UPI000347EDD7|nr:Uma2 family endonuclease [Geminocystis herdmanii]
MVAQVQIPTNNEVKFIPKPDVSNLITEDDTPVDNFGSEKQQRFLTNILYNVRKEQVFLACANVGIYYNIGQPPIVPDFFLSLDVTTPPNLWEKNHRCYLVWEFGKTPEVAIEIVSNKVGGELDEKLKIYQNMRVIYYVVFDPQKYLSEQVLRIFKLMGINYQETSETWLEGVNLGLTLWEGEFENFKGVWLRWCDENANLLLTGDESAQKAEKELQELKEKLRQQGINLD